MRRSVVLRSVVCATLFAASASAYAADEHPYLYQRTGWGAAGAVAIELESAVGTREARPFGERGLEQGVRARIGVTDRVMIEAWGGALFDLEGSGYQDAALSAEANVGLLRQSRHFVDLSLGVGYMYDYRDTSVPRVRLTASREFGPVDVTLNSLVEVPLAENRDAFDVLIGAAASYRLSDHLRIGAEVAGEDLEGFWEEEEAEGGARLVAGPTLSAGAGEHFTVKVNAGAVLAATQNATSTGDVEIRSEAGFLGRLALGWVF